MVWKDRTWIEGSDNAARIRQGWKDQTWVEGSDMGGRIRPGMDLTWVTWVQTVQWRIAATHPFTVGDKDKQAK